MLSPAFGQTGSGACGDMSCREKISSKERPGCVEKTLFIMEDAGKI
ncbi:MAG: hypothetical protein KA436_12835 [Oligoflexales bacterium]|nr:hypothetical protein [Oligoflexales bacterium]